MWDQVMKLEEKYGQALLTGAPDAWAYKLAPCSGISLFTLMN